MLRQRFPRAHQFIAARFSPNEELGLHLTAGVLLMALSALSFRGLTFALRYGNRHKSPNSGYPEAALAGILDCRFGGPNRYGGKWVDKPYIGVNDRPIGDEEIRRVVRINHLSCLGMVMAVLLFLYTLHGV